MTTTPSMLPQLPDNSRGEAERRRHAENKGRLAMVGTHVVSTGVGLREIQKRVDFGMTFIRKPFMSYGAEIDVEDVRDLLDTADGEDLASVQSSGFVYEWDTTPKGMYVGAWVAVSVFIDLSAFALSPDAPTSESLSGLRVEHHFSFQEVALKTFVPDQAPGSGDEDPGGV